MTAILAASHRNPWYEYAAVATAGLVIGAYLTFRLARKAGSAYLHSKFEHRKLDAILNFFHKWGTSALAYLRTPDGHITRFDPKGSTDTYTDAFSGLNDLGETTGYYYDLNGVFHGFLRAHDGTITTINDKGAGTGANQGTYVISINNFGVNAGGYTDSNNVNHGYLWAPGGKITTFDVTGAGTLSLLGDRRNLSQSRQRKDTCKF